ncbi:MAG: hypothetical protein QNJ58_15110 [Desulfobacterales bacterium]|nr:hypothetical protein [Desulfobacterales bacterium]
MHGICCVESVLNMTDDKKKQYSPFNDACQNILMRHPEAIGVAYKVLNCGCALICGATAGGDPIGKLRHISGQPVKSGRRAPICLKCRLDGGLDRVVWEGIYWPGPQSEWPEKNLRIKIGRKIFGLGYMEPD